MPHQLTHNLSKQHVLQNSVSNLGACQEVSKMCGACPDHHSTTRVGAQSWNDDNHLLHHCTVAVQWSHDDSALPGSVKAALESRPAGGTSQAALPDATASQQQVRAQVGMLCTLGCCWCVHNCSNANLTLCLCLCAYRALSSSGSECTLLKKEKPVKGIATM